MEREFVTCEVLGKYLMLFLLLLVSFDMNIWGKSIVYIWVSFQKEIEPTDVVIGCHCPVVNKKLQRAFSNTEAQYTVVLYRGLLSGTCEHWVK
jgi:hypothetical protein